MTKLFETGVADWPPKETLIEVLLKARRELKKGEDDWDTPDTCRAIQMIPDEWRHMVEGIDPVLFKNKMQRIRKDKLCPKVKAPSELVSSFGKFLRDFVKNRDRKGDSHLSSEYKNYVLFQSPEWVARASQHKELCNWTCQLCGKKSYRLHVHHTTEGYRNLGFEKPHHLIAVCPKPCHEVADMLRSGWLHDNGLDEFGFFDETSIPE